MLLYVFIKRFFDFIFSIFWGVFLFPLMLFIALLIKLDSKGSVFYRGVRTGKDSIPFKIYKFRTMIADAEKLGGPSTAHNDVRLTRIGRFLRKYKLDELPQLINIFLGQMSFVGPRPQVEKYTKCYNQEEKIILAVRPGLTDYASIKLINLDKILGDVRVDEKYAKEIEPQKNNLRIRYVKERSFIIDVKILIHTVLAVLKIKKLWNTK